VNATIAMTLDGRHRPQLRGELAEVDAALEAWARWAKTALAGLSWPSLTIIARVIEFGAMGAAARGASPVHPLEVDELCELVERAVMRLTTIERRVIVHQYLHWQPIDVSARHCDMTAGRFRVILHRARRSIGDYLDGAKLRYNKIANIV